MLLSRYKVKSYKLSEFKRKFDKDEFILIERILDNIKENKAIYTKLVLTTALMLHFNITVFASDFGSSLDSVGSQIVNMLLEVAKWGCIGMGLKSMLTTMINGGNMKQASTEGVQYFLGYLFIQFYPQLFDLFGKIKF